MNFLDILIIIVIALSVVLGVRDGLFKKIFGILGIVGGLVLATKYMSVGADYIMSSLSFSKDTSSILAFFILFIAVVAIINLFYRWIGPSRDDHMKLWSRIGGGILGIGQGLVAASLILLMMDVFEMNSEEEKNSSMIYGQVVQVAPEVFDYVTDWMPQSKKFFEEIREKIEKFKSSE
jgi:membrane protein required for colicin V production